MVQRQGRLKIGRRLKICPTGRQRRYEWWRFSEVAAGAYKGGRRIDNPPQVKNLPHNSWVVVQGYWNRFAGQASSWMALRTVAAAVRSWPF